LLEKVHPNIKQGFNEFALFELNPVHAKDFVDNNKLPVEDQRLAFVFVADDKTAKNYQGAPYYQAKKYLTNLLAELGITNLTFEPSTTHEPKASIGVAAVATFERQRAAYVKTADGELLGELGEFRSSVRKNLKLPNFIAGFELDVERLSKHQAKTKQYMPIPRFPSVEQDITLKVPAELSYAELFDFVWQQINEDAKDNFAMLGPVAIYQDDKAKDHKNVTLRLTIASYEKTLKTEEVNNLLDSAAEAAKSKFGAERI
jgi:phenylalanyl-tRNA synthetase beta chain